MGRTKIIHKIVYICSKDATYLSHFQILVRKNGLNEKRIMRLKGHEDSTPK